MSQRHASNSNLHLYMGDYWNNLPILGKNGPFIVNYLKAIQQVLNQSVADYTRVCVMRFDLRMPQYWHESANTVITRFKQSLKSQIEADLKRRIKNGGRPIRCRLRYVWVREKNDSQNQHYHFAIFLNRDAYFTLGRFGFPNELGADQSATTAFLECGTNMAQRIQMAWARALGLPELQSGRLVHFPENAVYRIDRNKATYFHDYEAVFQRLSYFAKSDTKHYGANIRNFGASQD